MARDFDCIVVVDGNGAAVDMELCAIEFIEFTDDECLSELLSVELIASIKTEAADGSFDAVGLGTVISTDGCASGNRVAGAAVITIGFDVDVIADCLLASL